MKIQSVWGACFSLPGALLLGQNLFGKKRKKQMPSINFSVVIPVYNSNRSLPELMERLHAVFRQKMDETYEIILVDDCSPRPETWKRLRSLAEADPRVRIFRLAKNFGQGCALLCGMEKARGNWIVTMDDDLQHRPEDIPLLAAHRDHDVVIARFPEKACGHFKKLTSNLKGRMDAHLLGKPRHVTSSPFRLMKRHVVEGMLTIRTPRPFIIAMILAVTSDVVNADATHAPRKYGRSNYTLRNSFSLISNMLFNNSSFMLRSMSVFGFALAGLSIVYGIYLVLRRLIQHHVPPGWTSLMVVVLISSGIIIFCLGILGEYVARLIETAEARPTWVIRESIDNTESNNTIDV